MEQKKNEKKEPVKKKNNTGKKTTPKKNTNSNTKTKITENSSKTGNKNTRTKTTTQKRKSNSSTPTTKKKNTTASKPIKKQETIQKETKKTTEKVNKPSPKKEIDLEKTQILSREDFNTYKKTIIKEEPEVEEKIYQTFGKTVILDNVDITDPEEVEDAIADIFSETGKIDFADIERGKLDALDKAPTITKQKRKIDIKFILLLLLTLGLICFVIYHFATFDHNKEKVVIKEVQPKIINENYVFFGDSLTHRYDLKKYFEGLPVVNSGKDGYKTTDLLSRMDEMLYEYNPSKVFLLIGTNDIADDKSTDDIVNNIKEIVKGIQTNRKNAKIYIESLYPIQSELVKNRDNKKIVEINNRLKDFCKEKKLTYIDTYSILVDDKDDLKKEYSDDGIHMTEKAYEAITKKLMPYVKETEKES